MKKLVYLLLATVLAGAALSLLWFYDWTRKGILNPAGGLPFARRVVLEVPHFSQNDPRWAADPLGPTSNTLGQEGCAVASAAMVLKSYGIDTDPGRLNKLLSQNGGYTERGWLYWEKAAETTKGQVEHLYEDLPSYQLIDTQLLKGNPLIVRVRFASGVTHFLVIIGKSGFEYLVRDPLEPDGVHPLSRFGSKIEALRFYGRLPSS